MQKCIFWLVGNLLQIQDAASNRDKSAYVNFIYRIYQGNPNFKDVQVHIVKSFLRNGDSFIRECKVRPVLVLEGNLIVAECMFISHPSFAALQVAFLECRFESTHAIDFLLDQARQEARVRALERIVVGLNGHVSYGVGFLSNLHDRPISFDSLYSAPWLAHHLDSLHLKTHTLSSWEIPMKDVQLSDMMLQRFRQRYAIRKMDMKRFREEMILFGNLANACLADTPWYFPKNPLAMHEIMKEIKLFLRPEHLLFATAEGKEVGFHFWHPDFNEVLPGGQKTSLLGIGLRSLFLAHRIKSFKLNAIGLLPEFRSSALLSGLLHETYQYTGKRFTVGETNFVWDSNHLSQRLNQNKMQRKLRQYHVYEYPV